MMQHSIVEYLRDNSGHRCGYCGSPDSNYSHGMWAHSLTCQDYQDLIDRGWRRSGKYVYKPTMDRMCCPLYTIRCHAPSFKISKSQKKILKRATKFFTAEDRGGGGADLEEADGVQPVGFDARENEDQPHGSHQESRAPVRRPQMTPRELESFGEQQQTKVDGSDVKNKVGAGTAVQEHGRGCASGEGGSVCQKGSAEDSTKRKPPTPGLGPDPNKPPCTKAKQRRLERKRERLGKRLDGTAQEVSSVSNTESSSGSKVSSKAKSLEEFIVDALPGQESKHRFEIKLVRSTPRSDEFQQTFQESYLVYKRYQMAIHNDPESKCTSNQYKRFLVDSPLLEAHPAEGPESGYGSFHQHYLLDGRIIAVGVVDILPACVSSVYFYYDPDYRFLTLGTFSALRELAFTRLLHATVPSLQYYYMGFYVHSCRKMRYKGQYYPSYLLCPETYIFHPIEECIPKLEVNKYSRFSPADEADASIELNSVRILHGNMAMTYQVYRQLRPTRCDEREVEEYAQMAGKTCAKRILLYRD